MRKLFTVAAVAAVLLGAAPAFARQDANALTPAQVGEVVDALSASLDGYFDPAKASAVKAALGARRSEFVAIADREALARALSETTLEASGDLHLKVSVTTARKDAPALSEAEQTLLDQRLAYGLMVARRLPANIGYLKLRYFEQTEPGAAMVDAALGLLAHTDALIIDLRENTGGGGAADLRLLGHLSRKPLVLETLRWRQPDGKTTLEARQVSQAPGGPLYADKPVFVLIANRTFSAAEALAYSLKANGRAVLIGEKTRGGGNPANRPPPALGYGLSVFVPNGQVVHPLTGGGWEGVGVTPDVAVAPDAALTEAFRRALAVAKPRVSTPKSEQERAAAIADPAAALRADQAL